MAHADLGDEPSSKSTSDQVEDTDKPKDPVAAGQEARRRGARAAEAGAGGPPFYEKWQFWAVAGAVVVGAVLLVLGGQALYHTINGGDVRPCNVDFQGRCFGEGH